MSSVPAPPADSSGTPAAAPRGRTAAALAGLALAQAPESLAYGLLALAPLGVAHGAQAMGLALACTVLANLVASLAGGGRLLTAPRASLALLCHGFVAILVAWRGPQGPLSPAHVLGLLACGLTAAGLLQWAAGWLRIGDLVKYTPHPVRQGLASGVALLLVLGAVPAVLGGRFGSPWAEALALQQAGAWAVAATAAGVFLLAQALLKRLPAWSAVPAVLWALGAGIAVQPLLLWWGLAPVPVAGVPQLAQPWFLQGSWPPVGEWLPPGLGMPLALFALTVALMAALDTLLACSVVDGRLRRSGDASREMQAHGLAAAVSGALCCMPASPSVQRSIGLIDMAPQLQRSVLLYALALAAWLLLLPQVLGWLPVAAIGAVLLVQGLKSVDPWLWQAPLGLWRTRGGQGGGQGGAALDADQRRLLLSNWSVALVVVASSLLLGLAAAVALGAALAVLLFVRANIRPLVRSQADGRERRSLKFRSPRVAAELQRLGERLAVLELQGALFFGTADALRDQLARLPAQVETAVLDLYLVSEIDATGARILLETAADWAARGRLVVAAEWPEGDPRRRVVQAMAQSGGLPPLRFAPDTDAALEAAEDRLLEGAAVATATMVSLGLADTQLAAGLDGPQLRTLAAQMERLVFAAGTQIYRAGQPADSLLVTLGGQVGVHLPGRARRLVSFEPGSMLGEMAALEGGLRSADAVAETPVIALKLPVAALERLQRSHPELAARVYANIARHLATRVRGLTRDLAVWTERHAVPLRQIDGGRLDFGEAPGDGAERLGGP